MNVRIDWLTLFLGIVTAFTWTMYVYSSGHKEGLRVGYHRGRSINFRSLADKE
jgi:hypothetical protein